MATQTMLKPFLAEIPTNLTNSKKIEIIESHVSAILETLGLNIHGSNIRETPRRVAKMYVNEMFSGFDPSLKPEMTLFPNNYGYKEMLLEKDITFYSYCEHHLIPFYGKAHIAYFPIQYVVGLSKLNRLVKYVAKKPQVQERLTVEICLELKKSITD